MKDDDDIDSTWTFHVGGEEVARDADKVLEAPTIIPVKATPVVEKKSPAVGKVLLDLGDIDNTAKLEIDRRPSKLRVDTEQSPALNKEAIKNMKAVEDTFEHAPLFKRAVAQFIDMFVIFLIFVLSAYFVPFGLKVTKRILRLFNLEYFFNTLTTPLLVQLVFIFIGIYIVFVVFLSATATTVGKKIMDLEVRDIDRPTITISQAFLREMILKPLSIISIFGILYVFVNKERKTLHDILSLTFVVTKK